MTVAIHAAWSPGEVRVAVVDDGILIDYAIWRPGAPDGTGDVHRGRVIANVPAMAGAFVALDGAEGFLPDSEGAKGLPSGAIVTVRVTRAAQSGKGPRLSTRHADAEAGPMGLLRRGIDPLREIAARFPGTPVYVDDPALAASLRASLTDRLLRVPRAFDDAIEADVEALGEPVLGLDSGARISFHPTPALVAIDVDGGGALTGRAARHGAINRAVVPILARQIRLRNLSGAILADLAGMRVKHRVSLTRDLTDALAADPLRPRFLGFTALGLAEIARPRVRPPLHELLAGPRAAGLAALRALAAASWADPGRQPILRAAPQVAGALRDDPVALPDLARIAGYGLTLRSDPSLSADRWIIETAHGQGPPLPDLRPCPDGGQPPVL